jgi:hypothetical protein
MTKHRPVKGGIQDMPFQLPRSSSVLASVLAAAGLALTVAGCSGHVTPLGPTPPQPTHLATPIVLQAVRTRPATPAGGCPAGYATLPEPGSSGPALCYRKFGTPVTFTSAAVMPGPVAAPVKKAAPVPAGSPPPSPTSQPASASGPAGLVIDLASAEWAALTAVTTKAYDGRGAIAITVRGKTWALPKVLEPITGGRFEILVPSQGLAVRLQHILVSSG